MRKPRYKRPNAKYHVTARTNRQEMILKAKQFKQMFLDVVREAKRKYRFIFSSFCIMDNHPHMDIEPLGKEDLSRIMQWILSVFARRYNIIMDYKGHVWYDRFKSKVIENIQQYLNTLFYIANNPVRAGIVDHPLKYEYNSLTFRLKNNSPGLLDPLPDWVQPHIDRFLTQYDPEKYRKPEAEYSFRDKQPGRPRKSK